MKRHKSIEIYRWIPSEGACDECRALAGDHKDCPPKPHTGCKCECVAFDKQINPRGNKSPYQTGFKTVPGSSSSKNNNWMVAVTCLNLSDSGDEEDGEEYEVGDTHSGEIEVPINPHEAGSPQWKAFNDNTQELLDNYARNLYENWCVGQA